MVINIPNIRILYQRKLKFSQVYGGMMMENESMEEVQYKRS
jgi:hypothetical protein